MRMGQWWLGDRVNPSVRRGLLTVLLIVWQALVLPAPAGAQGPVVRAVLFFSPTCPHCHKVINDDLPVIFQRFGGEARVYFDQDLPRDQVVYYLVSNAQVELLLINASLVDGNRLYSTSQEALAIPESRSGVPRLVVGDSVLVGSLEIPEIFPSIIESGLAGGGIDWPDIAGLTDALATFPFLQPLAAEEPDQQDRPAPASETQTDEPDRDVVEQPSGESPAATPDARSEVVGATAADASPGVEADTSANRSDASTSGPAAPNGTVESPLADSAGSSGEDSVAAAEMASEARAAGEDRASESTPAAGDLGVVAMRPSMMELYMHDPVGNGFSVLVLLGMLISLYAVYGFSQRRTAVGGELGPVVPLLSLLGIVVAGYLAYIEATGAEAVCGPVGDCNTVNQSEYAVLLGIPVGVLGLVAYVAIVTAWLTAWLARGNVSDWSKVVLLGITLFGTLFSIYLTFLEPFVIGATCAWCLTSAVVMTLLMLLAARPAFGAVERLRAT